MRRSDWKLYTGEVIASNWVDRVMSEESMGIFQGRGRIGTADIMVHRAGDEEPLFEGNFKIGGTTFHVLTRENYERTRSEHDAPAEEFGEMVVFRDMDMDAAEASTCNHDTLEYNANISHPVWRNRNADTFALFDNAIGEYWKRDDTGGMTTGTNFIDSINSTAGCPNTQQIVYMGVALDCNYVATYGGADQARTQVLNVWNQVSSLYRNTFNISLGIVELAVMNETCRYNPGGEQWNVGCDTNLTLDARLSLFSQWRGSKGSDGAGLWHLMSACPTDSEVGVAWLGTLCQTSSSSQSGTYVSGTGISTASRTEWSLVAHEIGHGFGAIHDVSQARD